MEKIAKAVRDLVPNRRESLLLYMQRERITQLELAQTLGCTHQFLGRILNGTQAPTERFNEDTIFAAIAAIKEGRQSNGS